MRVKLSDVCVEGGIQTGPFGAQLHQSDYSEWGTPVCMPVNLVDGSISENGIARVSEEHVERLSRYKIKLGDLLYARRGDVGRGSLVGVHEDGWLCGTGCLKVTPDPNKIDSRYLFYLTSLPEAIGWLVNHAKGTTMLNLNTGILSSLPLEIEGNLEKQRRIADILSAYDELIENNRRQIKLLEEAAQRLYKEWFVDLKFPGHETTPIVDGLPEGWKRLSLREYLVSHIGGGWGKEFNESSYSIRAAVIRATDIEAIRNGNVKDTPVRWHTESNFQKRKLEAGDIVFEVSGGSKETGVGRSLLITEEVLSMFDGPVICASFCKRMHFAESADSALLYWKIKNDCKTGLIRKYEKSSAGNIINFLWEDFLDGYELLIPSGRIKEQFENAASLYSKKLGTCGRRISVAREARDRLLPKLMSGEIEV